MAEDKKESPMSVTEDVVDIPDTAALQALGQVNERWREQIATQLDVEVAVEVTAGQSERPEVAGESLSGMTEVFRVTLQGEPQSELVIGFQDGEPPFLGERLESSDAGRLQPLAERFAQVFAEAVQAQGGNVSVEGLQKVEATELALSAPVFSVTIRLVAAEQELLCVQLLPLSGVSQLVAGAQSVSETGSISVEEAEFAALPGDGAAQKPAARNLELLYGLHLEVTVELGRTRMPIREILDLAKGAIVQLESLPGDPVELFVNGRKFAEGEVVVVEEHFGVRITHLVTPDERARKVEETR